MNKYSVTVQMPGHADATIMQGDVIDLGSNGILVWLDEDDSLTWRRLLDMRQTAKQMVVGIFSKGYLRPRRKQQ